MNPFADAFFPRVYINQYQPEMSEVDICFLSYHRHVISSIPPSNQGHVKKKFNVLGNMLICFLVDD